MQLRYQRDQIGMVLQTSLCLHPHLLGGPPITCAYSFVIAAYARTTNGYSYIGYVSYFRNLTLLLG